MSKETSEESVKERVEQKGGEYWNPETPGERLVGVVTDMKDGLYGTQWTIKTPSGEELITPSHRVLQTLMSKAVEGTEVEIEYLEEKESTTKGKSNTKMYKVWFLE